MLSTHPVLASGMVMSVNKHKREKLQITSGLAICRCGRGCGLTFLLCLADEATALSAEEGPHHGDSAEWWYRG